MSPIQQQRLIGAGLLILFIAVLAYLVLSKVGEHERQQTLEIPEPIEFSSVIEPIDDEVETFVDDGETMVDADTQQSIVAVPSVPVVEPVPTPKPEVAPAPKPAPETIKPEPKPEVVAPAPKPAPEAPKPTSTSTPTKSGDSWLIQLGSFSVQANAQALKAKVEQMGYKPYIETSQTSSGQIYRVRLPAVSDRSQADATAAKIKQQGMNAQVLTQ
ncbi:SPOR domain-containing protein [Methylophaga sp. OBS3]|uniref:SPOR domain-containing protein n=1 Tax=Methylophaga sp. OBS3 TaxID=2991934 RepID=UPI00225755D7|nr:SPOR domain-containing protein [Methylophaga sp. OBS3]MCX4189268.1 SPOR domain-containing protein [Methylophaga sp. OBS3]